VSELRRIWRIATRGPSWAADDLSGNGSARSAGRWNSTGMPVVYSSTTIALACLETVVHGAGLPVRRWLVAIDVPQLHWQARTALAPEDLPGWLLAAVPSVIVPEERNVLINPGHPACASLVARVVRPWSYEPVDLFRHRPPLSRVMSLEAMEQAVAAALATPDPRDASLISPAPAAPATPPDLRHSGNRAEPGRSLPASAG
jgi:RES domain-containing protein